MNLELNNKSVFISGSTQGIGFSIARQFLSESAKVIINGRYTVKTKNAVARLQSEFPKSDISGIAADFQEPDEVENLLDQLKDINVLINNVGIFELKEFEHITVEEWEKYITINVMSGIRLSQKLLPEMIKKKWGRIISISSESGVNVPGNMIPYGMSKAAVAAVNNGLAKLTKGTEVTVNTILGGPTYSDSVDATITQIARANHISLSEMKHAIMQQTNPDSLLQRFIKPSEIASLAVYLASPMAIVTNGACLRADGGVLKTI